MRVVVTGATGNVGTSLLERLLADDGVESVVGIARRLPNQAFPDVEWFGGDIAKSDLSVVFAGADAVVHLAWAIQPSHDEGLLWETNVLGTRRVFEMAAASGVPTLVYVSSIGAYSPKVGESAVDESWPTDGTPSSFYARHKAATEWLLDDIERSSPEMRVVRFRPALIFKRPAATGVRRLFFGPLMRPAFLRPDVAPVLPVADDLRFQAVHTDDVAAAIHTSLHREVSGAFNLHADPMLTMEDVARLLEAGTVTVPSGLLRMAVAFSWRLRLQPTPEGWIDMALAVPVMSSRRAHDLLGWQPAHSAGDALEELVRGMADRAGYPTPPLAV